MLGVLTAIQGASPGAILDKWGRSEVKITGRGRNRPRSGFMLTRTLKSRDVEVFERGGGMLHKRSTARSTPLPLSSHEHGGWGHVLEAP